MTRAIALSFILLCGLAARLSAAIVYHNMTNNTNQVNALLLQGQANSVEHGSQVTLVDGPRAITRLEFFQRIFGAGAAGFNMQIRFYRNDGPDGRPGTLFWASGILQGVIDSGGNTYYSVMVPNVYVPTTFTWTIQITNRQSNMSMMGPAEFNPPTVGSALFGYWRRFGIKPTDWEFTGTNEPPFSGRLTAISIAGDMNCDGVLTEDDVQPFVTALLDPAQFHAQADCPLINGDFDGDSSITGADIGPFVAAMLAP